MEAGWEGPEKMMQWATGAPKPQARDLGPGGLSGSPSDQPKAALDLSLERARGCLALYADGLSLNSLPCCTQSQAELEI